MTGAVTRVYTPWGRWPWRIEDVGVAAQFAVDDDAREAATVTKLALRL